MDFSGFWYLVGAKMLENHLPFVGFIGFSGFWDLVGAKMLENHLPFVGFIGFGCENA